MTNTERTMSDIELLYAYDNVAHWTPRNQNEADDRERLLGEHHAELVDRDLSW